MSAVNASENPEVIVLTLSYYPKWKERCIFDSQDLTTIANLCHDTSMPGFAIEVYKIIQDFLADRWLMRGLMQRTKRSMTADV